MINIIDRLFHMKASTKYTTKKKYMQLGWNKNTEILI